MLDQWSKIRSKKLKKSGIAKHVSNFVLSSKSFEVSINCFPKFFFHVSVSSILEHFTTADALCIFTEKMDCIEFVAYQLVKTLGW